MSGKSTGWGAAKSLQNFIVFTHRHRQQPGELEKPHGERPRRQHRDQPGLAAATIKHLTAQVQAVDTADELHRRHHLLLSGVGVSETRAASLLVEMPEPEVLHGIGEMVAYAGLNPRHLD